MSYTFFLPTNLLNNTIELYKQTKVALCGMVVHPAEYIAQGVTIQESAMLLMAKMIASTVLDHLSLGTLEDYRVFLEGVDIFDWGE